MNEKLYKTLDKRDITVYKKVYVNTMNSYMSLKSFIYY